MNFNIEIGDHLGEKLTEVLKSSDLSRDEIIKEALLLWFVLNEKSESVDDAKEGFYNSEDQVTSDFMTKRVDPPAQDRNYFE